MCVICGFTYVLFSMNSMIWYSGNFISYFIGQNVSILRISRCFEYHKQNVALRLFTQKYVQISDNFSVSYFWKKILIVLYLSFCFCLQTSKLNIYNNALLTMRNCHFIRLFFYTYLFLMKFWAFKVLCTIPSFVIWWNDSAIRKQFLTGWYNI